MRTVAVAASNLQLDAGELHTHRACLDRIMHSFLGASVDRAVVAVLKCRYVGHRPTRTTCR